MQSRSVALVASVSAWLFFCAAAAWACPSAVPESVRLTAHRHQAAHDLARILLLWAPLSAGLGWLLLRWLGARTACAARQGQCIGGLARRFAMGKSFAGLLILAPALSFVVLTFVLDGTVGWECSRSAAIDSALQRAQFVPFANNLL